MLGREVEAELVVDRKISVYFDRPFCLLQNSFCLKRNGLVEWERTRLPVTRRILFACAEGVNGILADFFVVGCVLRVRVRSALLRGAGAARLSVVACGLLGVPLRCAEPARRG